MMTDNTGNKLIVTDDGSSSIFSEQFRCTYHSVHGAIQESTHIFIQSGLDHYIRNTGKTMLKVLEFGFGTGLNALLSLKYCLDNNIHVDYSTIEAYPLSDEIVKSLNFISTENLSAYLNEFYNMHFGELNRLFINEFFTFSKYITRFEDFSSDIKFDLIYFDAFGPDEQSEFWTRPFLDKIPDLLNENGILVTYSVRGSFKRALKELGFKIYKIPGPPGKREILRAEKLI